MKRTILIGLSGLGYFIVSLFLFLPFRMKPIENYNLFALPFFAAVFLFLLYKACTVEKDSRGYLFGYFAGILMWQLFGETASLTVPSGLILQFSDMNIKVLGGYFYVLAGWALLYMLWKLKMLNSRAAYVFVIFLGIWSFEVYMDNYSSRVPLFMMGIVANIVMVVFLIASIVVLIMAKRSTSIERKTILGGVFYLTLNIVLMSSGQWKKPQDFYLKYEIPALQQELKEAQHKLDYIQRLKLQMIYMP
jgi:hypothetical protein